MDFSVRTFINLNAMADTAKGNVELPYNVQFNDLLEDVYNNLVCKPVLHKTNDIATANILFVVVHFCTEDINFIKREILGFLKASNIDSNDCTAETVCEISFF